MHENQILMHNRIKIEEIICILLLQEKEDEKEEERKKVRFKKDRKISNFLFHTDFMLFH